MFFINSIEKVKNITLFKLLLPEAILISYDSVNSDIIMLNAPQANNSLLKKYSKIKDLTI